MAAVRGILFDFHETLISADRWMVMETGGIAVEILVRLGVWGGPPPVEARQTVDALYATLRGISREAGVEYPAAEIARLALGALGLEGRFPEARIAEALEALFRSYLPDVTIKDGVGETLEVLARRRYRMGIVSNVTYAPFVPWALDAHGLQGYFERFVSSAELGLRKPRREIFTAALSAMGLAPGQVAYVGNDYLKDVMGAKLAGLWAVWVHTSMRPDAIAGRFSMLPDLIDRMQGARQVVS